MTHYNVAVCIARSKILLIITFRALTGWGLRQSKEFVEQRFQFLPHNGKEIRFDLILTAAQLGTLAYRAHIGHHLGRITLEAIEAIDATYVNPFDLTEESES